MLRQQLGDAAQGLLQSAHNLGELKVSAAAAVCHVAVIPGRLTRSLRFAKALVVSLQGSLADARAEGGRVHAALQAAEARVRTLEASGDTRVRGVRPHMQLPTARRL